MAVLKVMYDDGRSPQWFTDLTHVMIVEAWDIDDGAFPEQAKDSERQAAVDHAINEFCTTARMGRFGESQQRAILVTLEAPHFQFRQGVICPSGDTYLLGADGQNIDRLRR